MTLFDRICLGLIVWSGAAVVVTVCVGFWLLDRTALSPPAWVAFSCAAAHAGVFGWCVNRNECNQTGEAHEPAT